MDKEYLIRSIKGIRDILKVLEGALQDIEIATGLREKEPDKIKEMEALFPRLRELATEKSRAGFTEQVRQMITKRGYNKLSEVGCLYYDEMIKELEAMK